MSRTVGTPTYAHTVFPTVTKFGTVVKRAVLRSTTPPQPKGSDPGGQIFLPIYTLAHQLKQKLQICQHEFVCTHSIRDFPCHFGQP